MAVADALSDLTEGDVYLGLQTEECSNQVAQDGHVLTGFVYSDSIRLDDRLPAPLPDQLATELRRIGTEYNRLAGLVEARAGA